MINGVLVSTFGLDSARCVINVLSLFSSSRFRVEFLGLSVILFLFIWINFKSEFVFIPPQDKIEVVGLLLVILGKADIAYLICVALCYQSFSLVGGWINELKLPWERLLFWSVHMRRQPAAKSVQGGLRPTTHVVKATVVSNSLVCGRVRIRIEWWLWKLQHL